MDLLGRLTRADSRAGSAACRETKGTDGRGLPCVGHPHGGRCTSFLIRILTPGFGASQGLGGGQAPRAGLLTLTPPPFQGGPTACGKPTSSLARSWAPNPNPTVKTPSCPRTHENPLYCPSEGGKLWIKQPQKPDSVKKTSQSSETGASCHSGPTA